MTNLTPFPFQKRALSWLAPRECAILALEQGLGKTVVAALDVEAPAIVVCTAVMKYTWLDELALWRPDLKVQVIDSPRTKVDPSCDVHVINYDILHKVVLPWPRTLVVDEAQKIKTATTVRTKQVLAMVPRVDRIRFLTGTPMLSRPVELFPMLSAIGAVAPNWDRFTRRYCAAWDTPWGNRDVSGASNLDELAEVLAPFMLRMTKKQVAPDLPDKTYRLVTLPGVVGKKEVEFLEYEKRHLRLPENPIDFQAISDIRRVHAEKKLPHAIDYLRGLLEGQDEGWKLVVFAHHRASVEAISEALRAYGVVSIMGGTPAKAARDRVQAFQTSRKVRVFVGQTQAAGEGITLTAAHHVVLVEPSWVPGEIAQAVDRCHRLTTRFPVTADLLAVQGSIDARMLMRVLEKQDVIDQVIKETKMADFTKIVTLMGYISESFNQLGHEFEKLALETGAEAPAAAEEKPARRSRRAEAEEQPEEKPARRSRRAEVEEEEQPEETAARSSRRAAKDEDEEPAPRSRKATKDEEPADEEPAPRSRRGAAAKEDEKPKGPTLADVRRVSSKLIAARKRDILQEILEDFKASDLADLAEADYAEFIKEVELELK